MVTKYYEKVYNNGDYDYIEMPLDTEHIWYLQLNATITTAFTKYGIERPIMVIVEKTESITQIKVVRYPAKLIDDVKYYEQAYPFILDDLKKIAEANSEYDYHKYIIEII